MLVNVVVIGIKETFMTEEEEGDCGRWNLKIKEKGKKKRLNALSFNTSRNFNL